MNLQTYPHRITLPNRHWIRHRCDGTRQTGLRVYFNDFSVCIPALPGVTKGCPLCWRDFLSLRREWWDRYRDRAPTARPVDVARVAADLTRRIERPNCPANAICSHHGIHGSVDGLIVAISADARHQRLRIILEQSLYRRPAAVHRARVDAVLYALTCGAQEVWKGEDGHDTVTVVTTRQVSEGFQRAFANYLAIGSRCFNPTPADRAGYAAFEQWVRQ